MDTFDYIHEAGFLCCRVHRELERLPMLSFPFSLEQLPPRGIYFFYENGETWGHGGMLPRIVRIGINRGKSLQSRINEHFLLTGDKMNFGLNRFPPHNRSIFRWNIGRVILNKRKDPYLDIWNTNLKPKAQLLTYAGVRDIAREKEIEEEVTGIIRDYFTFRCILVENKETRLQLEKSLIGTVSRCPLCRASEAWMGRGSTVAKIKTGKLWQVQHTNAPVMDEPEYKTFLEAVRKTEEWQGRVENKMLNTGKMRYDSRTC